MRAVPRIITRAEAGRVVDAACGVWRRVIRAVRNCGRRVSRGPRVHRRYVNGRRHLTNHCENGNQPSMSQSRHAASVSLPRRCGIDRVPVLTS
jgi:hypothetical protein